MSRPPHARLAPSARLAVVLALLAVGASMAGADEPGGPARAQIRRRAFFPLALRLADGFAAPVEAPPTATARPTERPEATRTPEPTRRPEPTRAPEPTEPGGATPTATTTPAAASGIGQRLYKSGAIGVTADGRTVWSVNTFADRVARIDTAGGAVRDIDLPGDPDGPRGIAVADDGQSVWVACHDSDRVYVLDAAGAVARTIQLPFGSGPYGVALAPPVGGRQAVAVVTLHRVASAAVIDTATFDVRIVDLAVKTPFGITFTADAAHAWITHLMVDDEHPAMSRLDLTGGPPRLGARVMTGAATPRDGGKLKNADAAKNVAEGGYLNFRGHPALLPAWTGKQQIWVPTQYHNMHTDVLSPDTIIEASLRKMDPASGRISVDDKVLLTAVNVHDPKRGDNDPPWLGYGWDAHVSGFVDVAFARLSGALYGVALFEQSDDLIVLPADTPLVRSATDPNAPRLPETPVGMRPMGIVVSPTEPRAYVYDAFGFDVAVVDLADPAAARVAARWPIARPAAPNPLADPVKLKGARLFFASDDPRLSANGKVACASCHFNGEDDGRTWGFEKLPAGTAGLGHGPRSVHSLLGIARTFTPGQRDAATGLGQLHHSGDRDEIQDFEHTFRGPLMRGAGLITGDANAELGPPNAGRSADLDALADYLMSVPPLMRSPHRAADGALSDAAVRGAAMFVGTDARGHGADAACASCHVPETGFVDFAYHDIGQRRPAAEQELNDPRRGSCAWCVNTSTLLGLWTTSTYDGMLRYGSGLVETFKDFAASDRSTPHGHLSGLSGRQIADLAEFVLSIDGHLTGAEVRAARDTQPPRVARVAPTSRTRVEVWFDETVTEASASDERNYRLFDVATGHEAPVAGAVWDGQNGDHATLLLGAPMAVGGVYRFAPTGGIADAAAMTSGGVANVIDPSDDANRRTFTLTDPLVITLGASGYENVAVAVHDAAPVGSGLATWGHDAVQLANGAENVPGFVRFDWTGPFAAATGVQRADAIVGARFSLWAESGEAQTVELRRALQRWSDPAAGADWNQNPVGGPTWRDHSHPDGRWNKVGAAALGSTGADPADYDGPNDLTSGVDLVTKVPALNERFWFADDRITDAFRFWFAHPTLDYGYALRLRGDAGTWPNLRFTRGEAMLRERGPVLEITYSPGP